jgi:hypothetical protein
MNFSSFFDMARTWSVGACLMFDKQGTTARRRSQVIFTKNESKLFGVLFHPRDYVLVCQPNRCAGQEAWRTQHQSKWKRHPLIVVVRWSKTWTAITPPWLQRNKGTSHVMWPLFAAAPLSCEANPPSNAMGSEYTLGAWRRNPTCM